MKRIPRPVLRTPEALAQSPINTSARAMAEGQDFAHDTLYRALNQPLALCFEPSLELCKGVGGLNRGYLLLDDLLIQRYRSGKLGLRPGTPSRGPGCLGCPWWRWPGRRGNGGFPWPSCPTSKSASWTCWSGPGRRAFGGGAL